MTWGNSWKMSKKHMRPIKERLAIKMSFEDL